MAIPFLNNTSFSAAITVANSATASNFITTTDSGININGITLTRVAANSAIRVGNGLETLGLLRSYSNLIVATTGTFGGNVTAPNLIATTAVYSGGIVYGSNTLSLKKSNGNSYVDFDTNLNATFAGAVGVGVNGGSNAKLEVVSTTGEVFRADSSGGAFRLVVDQTGVNTQGVLAHTGTATFSGLVSGITPVNAANFVTKAYVDGSGGGTGPFLPLAGGTMTGDLTIQETENVYLTLESTNTSTTKEVAVKYNNYSTGSNYWWSGLNQSANYSLAYGSVFLGLMLKWKFQLQVMQLFQQPQVL